MVKLTPQQKILFAKWLQEQSDYLAVQIDNVREEMKIEQKHVKYREILCMSSGVNSLMTTKFILENIEK